MAVITIPALVAESVEAQSWGQVRYDVAEVSDVTGDQSVNAGAPARWKVGLRAAAWLNQDEAAAWEFMLLKLRGGINHLAVYDLLRPAPRGTLRGAPFLAAPVERGASTLTLGGAVGTLKQGDALQIGSGVGSSQFIKVAEDAAATVLTPTSAGWTTSSSAAATWSTASAATATWWLGGTMTVTFEAVARDDYPPGTAVQWDKPVTYVAMQNNQLSWSAQAGGPFLTGYAVDGLEQWS